MDIGIAIGAAVGLVSLITAIGGAFWRLSQMDAKLVLAEREVGLLRERTHVLANELARFEVEVARGYVPNGSFAALSERMDQGFAEIRQLIMDHVAPARRRSGGAGG